MKYKNKKPKPTVPNGIKYFSYFKNNNENNNKKSLQNGKSRKDKAKTYKENEHNKRKVIWLLSFFIFFFCCHSSHILPNATIKTDLWFWFRNTERESIELESFRNRIEQNEGNFAIAVPHITPKHCVN